MSAEETIDQILDVMDEYGLRSRANISTLIWAIGDSAESEELEDEEDSESDDD